VRDNKKGIYIFLLTIYGYVEMVLLAWSRRLLKSRNVKVYKVKFITDKENVLNVLIVIWMSRYHMLKWHFFGNIILITASAKGNFKRFLWFELYFFISKKIQYIFFISIKWFSWLGHVYRYNVWICNKPT